MRKVLQGYPIEYDERTDVRSPLPKNLSSQRCAQLTRLLSEGRARVLGTLTGWPGVTHTVRAWGGYYHVQLSELTLET